MEFELSKAIEILERTPSTLSNLLKDISLDWTHNNIGEDTWSPYDVIGHLIHGEKTDWITRTEIILSNAPSKTFIPFDRFAQFEASKGKSMNQLLSEFGELREANIQKLKSLNLSEEDFDKEGVHPEFGTVTLKQLLSTWVTHDLAHMDQIVKTMAKQYQTEVGPWANYISILKQD